MEITYNEVSIINILGLIQGITLGGVLLVLSRKRTRSTFFLGLFTLTYALELIPDILHELNLTLQFPQPLLLFFDFGWFLFPLFYLYVQRISILPASKSSIYLLIPGGLIFITKLIVLFEINGFRNQTVSPDWFSILDLLALIFSLFVGMKTYLYIDRHRKELNNQYSETQKRELTWAKQFLSIGIAFTVLFPFIAINKNYYFELTGSIINVVLLYWVSVRGILQQNVEPLILPTQHTLATKESSNTTPTLDVEKSKELFDRIELSILVNKSFLQPALTLIDVSNDVKEHPKRVSQVINLITKKNFKAYINGFRIDEAKKMLKDQNSNNLSIEGVGMEVGFKSKSSFYEAFKKETGQTPSAFKSQN